ncbi:MAG TPA: ShlB/FhaC/HecB family hemolysin secretion/activation protein [Stellaceae bacterium]|nr:ShlB/FhaC/HecB family hemolysin secretion/activation protein [Stellaceae bacterium]
MARAGSHFHPLRTRNFPLILLTLLLLPPQGFAQTPNPADLQRIERQQEDLIRQQQDQLELERRERLQPPPQPLFERLPEAPPAVPENAPCFTIREIHLTGVTLLEPFETQPILDRFLGKCLTLAGLNDVVRAFTDFYIDKGYVTSRAYLPAQDLKNGVLSLVVLEGLLERIDIRENGAPRTGFDTAFPGRSGGPLNLRDLEQGLDQINRLPSMNAQIKLAPGTEPGTSVVDIDTKRIAPWHASAEYNNYGQPATGENQASVSLGTDDLLGLYDSLSLAYGHDTEFTSKRGSENASGDYSIPFGYWLLHLSSNWLDFRSTVQGQAQSFRSTGYNIVSTGEIDRTVYRDDVGRASVGAFLTSEDTRNFVENIALKTSSRRLTYVGARLSGSRRLFDGIFNDQVTIEQGIRALGALHDEADPPPGTPVAQFTKLATDVSFSRGFRLAGEALSWSTVVHFEGSPTVLFGTERVAIGGSYTVRGFNDQTLSGDIGGYTRNDLSWALPLPETGPWAEPLHVSAYVALDAGWVTTQNSDPTGRGKLVGSAIGLKGAYSHFTGELTLEKALASEAILHTPSAVFRFRIGTSF